MAREPIWDHECNMAVIVKRILDLDAWKSPTAAGDEKLSSGERALYCYGKWIKTHSLTLLPANSHSYLHS